MLAFAITPNKGRRHDGRATPSSCETRYPRRRPGRRRGRLVLCRPHAPAGGHLDHRRRRPAPAAHRQPGVAAGAHQCCRGWDHVLRHRRPHQAEPDRALQVSGLAPLRFRRLLCLHLVGGKWLCRRHRRDPRPRRPDAARADRALVDARAVGGGRRDRELARPPSPLPSPAAPRQPALYQLLAWRLRDPRHRRYPPSEIRQRARLEPALSVPDPHRIADPARVLMGRKIAVVTDEEVSDRLTPSRNAFLWIVDITDETHPIPVATWRVPHDEPFNRDCWFGAHQPQETVDGNIILVTWFGGGLRAVEIANPYRPEEVGNFMPAPGAGQKIVQSNDVFVDQARGLVYLIDRLNGLDILEYGG